MKCLCVLIAGSVQWSAVIVTFVCINVVLVLVFGKFKNIFCKVYIHFISLSCWYSNEQYEPLLVVYKRSISDIEFQKL